MHLRTAALIVCSLALVALGVGAQESNPVRRQPAAHADVQRLIVRLRADTPGAGRTATQIQSVEGAGDRVAALATRAGVTVRSDRDVGLGLHALEVEPQVAGESLEQSAARLRADSAVEYAVPDRRRFIHAVPNDPLYSQQWHWQKRVDAPSATDAEHAWDITTGSAGVVIAVIDTGVLFDHPDLGRAVDGGRLLPGYDFISDATVANDGDGRDSDPSDPGDWVTSQDTQSQKFNGCDQADSSWHGTEVASLIAARTNNGQGVAGGTWSPWILPVRALGKCGGYDSDIIAAMLWAAGIHVSGVPDNPYPAQIENLSLGAVGSCLQSYVDAVDAVTARGVLVVASAGNEGGPVDSPANCPGVAGVAGLRHVGTKVGFSSLGPEVALGAPAGNCVNLTGPCLMPIETASNSGTTGPSSNTYAGLLGTSFSAPIVAAIGGLMLAADGNLSYDQLIARLQEGSVRFPKSTDPTVVDCHVPTGPSDLQTSECNCTTSTCGAGMANALGAVNAALRPIATVLLPTSVVPTQNVTLDASGSGAACGHTITGYAWSVVSGSAAIVSGETAATAVISHSTDTSRIRVVVTDDAGLTDSADVLVASTSATSSAPATAGANACLAPVAAPTPPVTVTVSPSTATVAPGATQLFAATLTNTTSTDVIWQVNGVAGGNATIGTIAADGTFTAPAVEPTQTTVTVTALWAKDTTKFAAAQVTLTASPQPAASSGGGGGGGGAGLDLLALVAAALAGRRFRVGRRFA